MQYLEFKSKKQFLNTDLSKEWFLERKKTLVFWHEIKPMLLHKDCPKEFIEEFSNDPQWYIRLVAMCNKYSWKSYFEKAIKDKKSTVRKSMYVRALNEPGFMDDKEIYRKILEDKWVHNYFKMDDIKKYLGVL